MNFNDWFIYDITSPSGIRWRVDRWSGKHYNIKTVSKGDVVGTKSKRGYWGVILKRKSFRVSRVIWEMHFGIIKDEFQVDHIDHDKSNNKLENLRLVSNAVNKRNSPKYANNKSSVTGVRLLCMCGQDYWSATWTVESRRKARYFSTKIYGYSKAFELACKTRSEAIEALNLMGAGYSELHGK